MTLSPHLLQNKVWQLGVLPETGASIAHGRMRYSGTWLDVLRPTDPADYDNSSKCSSFIMLPWNNRIGRGILDFRGQSYQMRTTVDDGTARHGDVRQRPWQVEEHTENFISMVFNSADHEDVNFPFAFEAQASYELDGADLVICLSLHNRSESAMPGGFGHHPYFVRPSGDNAPLVEIPCTHSFPLTNFLATGPATPLPQRLDFQDLKGLPANEINDVFTQRQPNQPARIVYPAWKMQLIMEADPLFLHWLLFTPVDQPFFALEPMTQVNDGFRLAEAGVEGTGVFALEAGEHKHASLRISLQAITG